MQSKTSTNKKQHINNNEKCGESDFGFLCAINSVHANLTEWPNKKAFAYTTHKLLQSCELNDSTISIDL